jgi:lipopolysaccharide export system permease protein
MKILDRYISREYIRAFIFSISGFVLVYVIVDLFENIDKFIDTHARMSLVGQYYLFYIPYIAILVLPVATLLASLYSIGTLARNRELIAMKGAGISLYRILRPVFLWAVVISLIALLIAELVIPWSNEKKTTIRRVAIEGRQPVNFSWRLNFAYSGSGDRMYHIGLYNGSADRLERVVIRRRLAEVDQKIEAREAVWEDGGWTFRNGQIRTNEERIIKFDRIRILYLDETPANFQTRQRDPQEMNYFQLKDYIDNTEAGGGTARQEIVDLNLKLAFPLANFIIVLFGAPLASNPRRGGKVSGFAISLVVCIVYWGFLQAGRAIGHRGTLPPVWAAWSGNIFFGILGSILFYLNRKN